MINTKLAALGLVGLAAVGGGVAFVATDSGSAAPAAVAASSTAGGSATVNVASAQVAGRSEPILETATGLPLYYYTGDTPTNSNVNGALAKLWPPLDSASPTESGTSGKLTVVNDSLGPQVQYNGQFLYTFIGDSAGHVTGQGVQNFYVATPIETTSGAIASSPIPAPASSNSGSYGGY
jgi:predicted lipoprotein with Yx(FWY)xxD motif